MGFRRRSIGLFAVSLLCLTVGATNKANFDGQWIMDKSKAEGIPPNMEQRMKVVQDGDKIDIETDLFEGDEVNTVPDHYLLDGKEHELSMRLTSGGETKGKRMARWNETGNGFEVRDIATVDTTDSKITITMVRKWLLGDDGKSLIIEILRTAPEGEIRTKRTFNRK